MVIRHITRNRETTLDNIEELTEILAHEHKSKELYLTLTDTTEQEWRHYKKAYDKAHNKTIHELNTPEGIREAKKYCLRRLSYVMDSCRRTNL
jgi:hypothetical protein